MNIERTGILVLAVLALISIAYCDNPHAFFGGRNNVDFGAVSP